MKNHYRYTKLLNSSHIGNKKSRQHHLDVAANLLRYLRFLAMFRRAKLATNLSYVKFT